MVFVILKGKVIGEYDNAIGLPFALPVGCYIYWKRINNWSYKAINHVEERLPVHEVPAELRALALLL